MQWSRLVAFTLAGAFVFLSLLVACPVHAGNSYLSDSGGYDHKGGLDRYEGGSRDLYDSAAHPTKVNPYSGRSGIDKSDPYLQEKDMPGTKARSLGSLYEPPSEQ